MSLAKGPFDVLWGTTVLGGIETLDVTYDVATDTLDTIQGVTYTLSSSQAASAEATFLETDVASLSAVLPQYKVNNAGVMSTGETVTDAAGALDVVPGGVATAQNHSLIITSAGNPGQVARLVNCATEIADVEVDKSIRKVHVRFTGEPAIGDATIQFFKEGTLGSVT